MYKRIISSIAFLFIINTIFAQDLKVYNQYSFSNHFSNKANVFQIEAGQILEFKKAFNFRFIVSANYSFNTIKKNSFEPLGRSSNVIGTYTNDKSLTRSNLTLPIAFEVDLKGLGIGISQEIISLGFNNKVNIDSTNGYFSTYPTNATFLGPNKAATIFSGSDKNNLATMLYIIYTFNDAFALKLGLSRQKILYNFLDSSDNKIELVGIKQVMPFVSLRFNIEK